MMDVRVGASRPASGCRPGAVCVLFVEDHPDTRTVMSRLLVSEGYGVLTAGTIAEAKRILATEPVHVLVCDVELPDGDGCELGEHISPGRAIAVSGHAATDHKERCHAAGFSAYLVKPVRWEDLRAAVHAAADAGGRG
jgi:CheY-like chemotaxis protein